MSKAAVEQFRAKVAHDSALQAKVRGLGADKGAEVVALGRELGFQFTQADLEAALEEGELSDFELEVVSGGTNSDVGVASKTR